MKRLSENKGFTLIEILIVIGIIAILAAIVLVAINPARQFAQAHNTQRVSNVNAILNAVGQKLVDDKGSLKDCSTNIPQVDPVPNPLNGTTGKKITSAAGSANVDLGCLTPIYIPALPFDPTDTGAFWADATAYNTGYNIFKDVNGRITVFASSTELGVQIISVTR